MTFTSTDAEKAAAPEKSRKAAAVAARLNNLPAEAGRSRVLESNAAAAFWGVSLPHWRRLYRAGKVPAPVRIGERKLGWRLGDLIDGLAQRAA